MRDTYDSNSRTALLSALSEPQLNLVARQLRLDFGGAPFVLSDYNAVIPSDYVSDDYYGHIPWGDSCITETSSYFVRMVNRAAWGAASDYLASWTTGGDTASDWDLSDIANTSGGTDPECYPNTRIGLFPKATSNAVYVWYADTNGNILRVEWDVPTQVWSGITSASYDIGDAETIAIHPVSESSAFVVWVQDNGLYLRRITWGGASWTADDSWLVWRSEDIEPIDALYSDAELLSGTTYSLMLNLAFEGATYSALYDSTTKVLSQPIEAVGSNAEWTAQRTHVTGLSKYNSRLWAVVQRSMMASDETPQAQHVALISSADGKSWRVEDFIGLNPCYGKLLYVSGGTYCYIVGNAVVYKANATYKLGTDLAGMKRTLDEVGQVTFAATGLNTPYNLQLSGIDVDSNLVTDSIMCEGTEIEVQIREAGESYTTLAKTRIAKIESQDAWGARPAKMQARGHISLLAGKNAWQHPTGRQYDSPSVYYTDFNFEDTGLARISAAAQSGIWMTEKDPRHGKWHLTGRDGHAVIPRKFTTPWLTVAAHFWFRNSTEVGGLIFFWQDENNYWRAGVRRSVSDQAARFVLEKVVDGEVTSLDTGDPPSWANLKPDFDGLTKEIGAYLDIKPEEVRVIFLLDDTSDDFSGGSAVTLTHDLTTEDDPPKFPHHVGYEMTEWIDQTGGYNQGSEITVTDSGDSWIESSIIKSGVTGKALYVDGRWYRIKWTTPSRYYLRPNLVAPPPNGSAVGIYEFDQKPKIVMRDIAVCDGSPAWTVDDLATNIMEQAGLTRESSSETVYNLGHASADIYYHIDMRVTTASPKLVIHGSKASGYSGWLVEVAAEWCTLKKYDAGTPTTVAVYPNLIGLSALASTEIRFIWYNNTLFVYAGDHFLCAFWEVITSGSGYSGPPDTVNATTTEFPTLQESFILDAGQNASAALANLLRGRPARMLERQDGVKLSRFENHPDLGTWSTTVLGTKDGVQGAASMIEIEGADVRQYYLEKETARTQLRYRRARNESAEGDLLTLKDAARVARLDREKANTFMSSGMTPDIAAEPEDLVAIDSVDYIIEGFSITFSRGKANQPKLKWRTQYKLREAIPDPTIGEWHTGSGTSTWGAVQWG